MPSASGHPAPDRGTPRILDPMADRAVADLAGLSDFKGPRRGGHVAPTTLFRGLVSEAPPPARAPDPPDGT